VLNFTVYRVLRVCLLFVFYLTGQSSPSSKLMVASGAGTDVSDIPLHCSSYRSPRAGERYRKGWTLSLENSMPLLQLALAATGVVKSIVMAAKLFCEVGRWFETNSMPLLQISLW
jgi:hypothetical protein